MKENEALSAKAHKKPTHPWKVRVWISKNNDKKAWINFEKSLTNNTPGKEHSKWDVACLQQERILTWWVKKGYPSKIILCFMHFGNYSKNWVENLSSFLIFFIICDNIFRVLYLQIGWFLSCFCLTCNDALYKKVACQKLTSI